MTRRDPLASLPASVRAINPTLARSTARATGRTAKRNGDAFEREVFAALATLQRVGVLAWWSHTSPDSKRLRDGRTIDLAYDGLMLFSLTPGNGVFSNMTGTMNFFGSGQASVLLPAVPALVGVSFFAGGLVLDPAQTSGVGAISPPKLVVIQ